MSRCWLYLVVAEQYNLNPFTREIYAFPDKQNKGIFPVVGVSMVGAALSMTHPQYDGVEFVYADKMVKMPGANCWSALSGLSV